MIGYDLRSANEHAAARRLATPMGYSGRWQWLRSLLPRIDRRAW